MGIPLPRSTALAAGFDAPIEEWPYLDIEVLVKTRSREVCMTCHWFRHHAGVNCIPGSARASLSFTTTPEEIDRFAEELEGTIAFLREHS